MKSNEEVVCLKALKMSFGDKEVLKGVNLSVHKGEIVGYIGPNGAGKSTTIKILLGLLQGYSGEVTILGQDISKDGIEYKRKIGYVPELADIYDTLTASEYLEFIGEMYGVQTEVVHHKAVQLMKLFGIEEVYESRISSFSKGMKQKVVIISSLLHNPDIIFWDEPLSGLDANSVSIVKEVLAQLANQGKTIFYSSHIMDVVEKISNRIVLIDNGEIIADGSFEELKDKSTEGSLEQIFNQLTGFDGHVEIAREFVSIVEGTDHENL